MAVDEPSRRVLPTRAAQALGAEAADVLMGALRTEIKTAITSQTRWMVTILVLLGALYATVTVLGR